MMSQHKKITLCLVLASFSTVNVASTFSYNDLPNIGTAASSTLSVEKEIEFGDAHMRTLRATQPLVNDPVLNDYISGLGASLVSYAQDVKTPFNFFLVQQRDINAFALFGGYIGLHTGLFIHAESESEFASVMSHEIAHLTQRHLARAMEDRAKTTPLTIAALVGSALLAIAAPQAGMAALQATGAATIQNQINYTRSNEQEADRIGIELLSRAGFDARGMPAFFGRLSDQYRFSSKPPQMLLTHPLPESRVAESRTRAEQYPKKDVPVSIDYHLARARVVARFIGSSSSSALNWFNRQLKNATPQIADTLNYGKAVVYLDNNQHAKAEKILNVLIKKDPNNLFYIDAMTDLNINQKKYTQALTRLNDMLKIYPDNRVLLINRSYTQVEQGKYREAQASLQRYAHRFPQDQNVWTMLIEVHEKQGNRHASLSAQGELAALQGKWDDAINNYTRASELATLGSFDQARYDARIDQLRASKVRSANLFR